MPSRIKGKVLKRETDKISPICESFPEMKGEEYLALVEDIKKNGLIHPILKDKQGEVIDGRNRLSACRDAGVKPRFRTVDGDHIPWSMNIVRRHMSTQERAVSAIKYADLLGIDLQDQSGTGKASASNEAVAKAYGVGHATVSRARKAIDEAGLTDDLKSGKVSVAEAAKAIACREAPEPQEAAPKPGYDIVVADYHIMDKMGGGANSHPAAHKFIELGASDHLLFLKVPVRRLMSAYALMEQAGYSYVSHLVAKIKTTERPLVYDTNTFLIETHEIILVLEHGVAAAPVEPVGDYDFVAFSELQEPWDASLRRYIEYCWPGLTRFSFLGWDQVGWDNQRNTGRSLAAA